MKITPENILVKPCPFCGGDKLSVETDDIDGWVACVKCHKCADMQGPMSEYKYQDTDEAEADAVKQWNKRADPSAEIARLRADVERKDALLKEACFYIGIDVSSRNLKERITAALADTADKSQQKGN